MTKPFSYEDATAPAAGGFSYEDAVGAPPPKPAGAIRRLADKAVGFGAGALGATKAIADVAGAGGKVAGVLGNLEKGAQELLSPEAQADQAQQQAILDESKGKGVWEGVKAGARAFGVAPVQTAVTGLGSVVPTLAAGLATGGASVPVTLGAMGLMGAAQGAGSVKGGIYDDLKQRGATEEQATAAQEYTGPNAGNIAVGAALGAADASTGVTKAATSMLRRGVLGQGARIAEGSTRGVIARTALGAAGEVPLEAAQGAQQQYAQNVAAQREGYQVDPLDNVVSQGTFEGLASAGPGAAFGAFNKAPAVAPAPPAPPAGPLARAAALALPAPVVRVDSEGGARMDGAPPPVTDEPAANVQGRAPIAPEPAGPLTRALPAPVVTVNEDGTAMTAEQRTGQIGGVRELNRFQKLRAEREARLAAQDVTDVTAKEAGTSESAPRSAQPEPGTRAAEPLKTASALQPAAETTQPDAGSLQPVRGTPQAESPQGSSSAPEQAPSVAKEPANVTQAQAATEAPAAPAAVPETSSTAPEAVAPGSGATGSAGTVAAGEPGTALNDQTRTEAPSAKAAADQAAAPAGIPAEPAGAAVSAAPGAKPEVEAAGVKPLAVGITPGNAEPVTVKNGIVHIGKGEALNFDTGEPIKVAEGASHAQIKQALKDGGALSRRQKFYGGQDTGTTAAPEAHKDVPQSSAPTNATPDTSDTRSISGPAGQISETQESGGKGNISPESSGKHVDSGKSPATETVVRPANWRGNFLQAARVAKGLGIDPKGKKLAGLVAEIDAKDAPENKAETISAFPKNTPASTPEQPPASAKEQGGAVVAPTPVESLGKSGGKGPAGGKTARNATWDRNPFRAFIGNHGVAMSQRNEFAPGLREMRAALVPGYGPIFRKNGQPTDILAQRAVEEGFLLTPDVAKLEDLIHRALKGEKITPQFSEGVAESEAQARMERQRELAAESDVGELSGVELDVVEEALDDIPELDAKSNTTTEDAMRALGFTEQEISDETAKEPRGAQADRQGGGQPVEAAGGQAQGNRAGGNREAPAEGLTAPTRADILAQQAQKEAEQQRKDEAPAAVKSPTRDQIDLLNPQGGIFDEPAAPAADAKAEALAAATKTYDESLATFRAASRTFTAIRQDYRDKKIGDTEYLAAKSEFDKASEVADAAETAFIAASNSKAKPSPAKQPAAPVKSGEAAKIEDFGEKLEGARKDKVYSLSAELTDEALATEPLSKVWPADEWEGFEDDFVAAVAHTARAEVPAKPRTGYKVARWVEKVKAVRGLAKLAATGMREKVEAGLKERSALAGFYSKVKLLQMLPREQWKRIGAVQEAPDAYRYDGDKKVASPLVMIDIDGRHNSLPAGTVADALDRIKELLGTEVAEKKMQFEVRGRGAAWFINKTGDKEYRHLKEFASSGEALKFARDTDNYAALVAAWDGVKERDNVKETDLRSAENRPRSGADHRGGKDVSAEQFQEKFGFRGGQFGNWVGQGDGAKARQGMLNQAYDAFMDLAEIVGIPPKAISLNGTLGMSFGARGHGWASAHFEPSNLVINLTKTRGAGTLAHEWFHALDNYFARARGGEVPFNGNQQHYRDNNYITYKPEPMMAHVSGRSTMTKAQLEIRRKENPQSGFFKAENWTVDPKHPEGVRPEVEVAFAELVKALNASPMAARARSIDKSGENGYWSQIIERGARSFENFIISKMMEKGYDNDYLANVTPVQDFKRSKERYPYLLPEEVAPIAEAFDALFNVVQTKETETGTAMFRRSDAESPPLRVSEIRATLQPALDALKVPYAIHATLDELKIATGYRDIPNGVKGAHFKGKLHLVAENINGPLQAEEVFWHEVNHAGLDVMYGSGSKAYEGALRGLVIQNKSIREAAKVWMDKYGAEDMAARIKSGATVERARLRTQLQAIDEALAEMAGRNVQINGLHRFIAAAQKFLREIGLNRLADAIEAKTDSEALAMILGARDAVTGRRQAQQVGALQPAFSKSKEGAANKDAAPVEDKTKAAKPAQTEPAAPKAPGLSEADKKLAAMFAGKDGDFLSYSRDQTAQPDESGTKSVLTGQPLADTWAAPDASKLDDVIYSMQDKHVDTRRVVQAVRAAIGTLADNLDPYLQEELYHGRAAMATKEFLEKSLRPLLGDLQSRGIAMSDFEEYLHNRHAQRRNEQVAKVNPQMPDGGSGIQTADAQAYLAALPAPKRAAYQALAQRVDQINRETRALLVSSGLEKQTTIDAWQAAYGDEYVPLMREEMDNGTTGIGQGFSVRGGSSKRALGSDKPVANILANIALQREKAITRSEKRKVGEAVYGMALKAPKDDFWFAVDPKLQQNPQQVLATAVQLISMGLDPQDAESIAREPSQRYVDQRTGLVANRINPALRSADNVLSVRIDGEDKYVFFNAKDPRAMRMVTALKNLDADQLGSVMGNVAKMTRYFSAINTQWNPVFGVTNITRDVQTALLNLNSTTLKHRKADVMKHILPALRGIYIDLRDHRAGKQPTSAYAAIFEEFQREGGATGYRDMYANAGERAESIADELAKIKQGKALGLGRAVMGWLSDYNESMENAVRVSAYMVAKDQGMTNQQAASLAKNLTVNFNRKGQVALQAGALYAFFNASVQGSARIAQTLFEGGKLSAVGQKIIAGGVLLGAMQALLLAAAGFDDEEPPDFVRARSLVFPIGGDKYVSIPMPLGFHVLPNLGRIPAEWAMSGFKNTPKRIAQLVGVFAEAFNPIGSAGLSLQTITPTIIDPLAALSENRDWTGKPIAKTDFNKLAPTAGHTRAKDTATPWARMISYAVNYATGGTDYKPGEVSPTPDQIDYLIGQVAGGIGREAGKLAQVAGGAMSGEEVPMFKIPLVGRFVGTTEGQAAEASRFYNNLRELGEHKAELDGLRKDHKMVEAASYRRENPPAQLVPMAERIHREVSKLHATKRSLIAKGAPPAQVKMLDARATFLMKSLNDRMRTLEPA